jgi:hypothetical protein
MVAGWDPTSPGLYYVDSDGQRTKGQVFTAIPTLSALLCNPSLLHPAGYHGCWLGPHRPWAVLR